MFTASSSVFSVENQARALCSQKAAKDKHKFLVGTCSIHDENGIEEFEYLENSNTIQTVGSYQHTDQIFDLESSPYHESFFISSWLNKSKEHGLTLWRLPENTSSKNTGVDDNDSNKPHYLSGKQNLKKIAEFDVSNSSFSTPKWHPVKDLIAVVNTQSLSTWSVTESSVEVNSTYTVQNNSNKCDESLLAPAAISWDPHGSSTCAMSQACGISIFDTKKMEQTCSLKNAHNGYIRDLDYNPNRPHTLASCGDDRKVKFWDTRSMLRPLKVLEGHSHWVWRVRFNPFHDQLLLSGGTDHTVCLWRVASCSSAPWLGSSKDGIDAADRDYSSGNGATPGEAAADAHLLEGFGAEAELNGGLHNRSKDPPDAKVRHIDQHEEGVYSLAWSASDAWVYCSLSLDGRVIVNHVPSTEKYKILL